MKIRYTLLLLIIFIARYTSGQTYFQYFDGADTICQPVPWQPGSICITFDSDTSNIWQVGKPQKPIFDSAATYPNVLVTDTTNFYPVNNSSVFSYSIQPMSSWGIVALQWKQKLDMDDNRDGGIIEFSLDGGIIWQNAFNNPYVYNFYGFDTANQDTLPNGAIAFSGRDTVWKDVWLCFDMSMLWTVDSLMMRYTFTSDSTHNNREGWMIDNMIAHTTVIHTVDEKKQEKYLNVHPNPASDIIHIEAQKRQEFHLIEHMTLVNTAGQVVDEWHNIPTKFFIDSRKYSSGLYYLHVKTNIRSETVPVIINHN